MLQKIAIGKTLALKVYFLRMDSENRLKLQFIFFPLSTLFLSLTNNCEFDSFEICLWRNLATIIRSSWLLSLGTYKLNEWAYDEKTNYLAPGILAIFECGE